MNESEMIVKIGIENFKAFGDYQEIELNRLTLVSGLNSSGKSSIYQSLLLLAQSENRFITDKYDNKIPTLDINGDFVKFGTATDIMHDKNKKYVRFVIGWSDGTVVEYRYDLKINAGTDSKLCGGDFALSRYAFSSNNEVQIEVVRQNSSWEIYSFHSLVFGEYKIFELIDLHIREQSGVEINRDEIEELDDTYEFEDDGALEDPQDLEEYGANWTFLPKVNFKKAIKLDCIKGVPYCFEVDFDNMLECVNPLFRDKIDRSKLVEILSEEGIKTDAFAVINANHRNHQRYSPKKEHILLLPPFRGYPKRIYSATDDENPLNTFNRHKNKKIQYCFDFDKNKKIKGTLDEAITFWLVNHFKVAEKIEVNDLVPDLVSEIFLTIAGERIPINNVGFGASQIVPVIFRILVSNEGSICIVDEPEIHLHPSIQSKLADFFFAMALTGKQILIETHSEYILDKLIFLILKHDKHKSNLSMYWTKKDGKQSKIEEILYDDLGFLSNQPDDFLAEKSKLVELLSEIRLEKLRS